MKKLYCLGLLLFSFLYGEAQMTDLQKLSRGKFYSSDEIRDGDNNIKGYFLLFQTDKIAKETFELEYVVLDENLNKVTNGFFSEMKFESLLIKAERITVDVSLYKNKLLLGFADYLGADYGSGWIRFRILDLETNKLSEPFVYNKDQMVLNHEFDRKMKNYSENQSSPMSFIDNVGLLINTETSNKSEKDTMNGNKFGDRYLAIFDENLNQKWKSVFFTFTKKNKNNRRSLSYLDSDKEVMVFYNFYVDRRGYYTGNNASIMFYKTETGELINEFFFGNLKEFAYKIVDVSFTNKEIILLGNFSLKQPDKTVNLYEGKNKGLFSYRINKEDGKLIESKFLYWKDKAVADQLKTDENGFIEDEGNLFIHKMLKLNNDKIIAVCESYKMSDFGSYSVNDMFFLELSADLKLLQVFKVDKFKNKLSTNDIINSGYFDFMSSQNLGDDEYLFFFMDNEKKAKTRSKSTKYGVVSYSEGKFNRQTLNLKTETSKINAFPAKKGYIMLIESFDDESKPSELRLEKINY